jgi:hypothetical protein
MAHNPHDLELTVLQISSVSSWQPYSFSG